MGLDLGITTYLFLVLNFLLLFLGITRLVIAIIFTVNHVFVYCNVKEISLLPLIYEATFVAFQEEAMFLLGLLGGFKNNLRLMFTYEFLMLLLIGVKLYSMRECSIDRELINDDIHLALRDMMFKCIYAQQTNERQDAKKDVERVQEIFKCCGLNDTKFWINNNESMPNSCCPIKTKTCNIKEAHKQTCKDAVQVPKLLYSIQFYSLIPVFEIILFLLGLLLMMFIRKTAANALV